jgi:hypothetical protein
MASHNTEGTFGFNFVSNEVPGGNHLIHCVDTTRDGTPAFGQLFVGDVIAWLNGIKAKETCHDDILAMLRDNSTVPFSLAANTP